MPRMICATWVNTKCESVQSACFSLQEANNKPKLHCTDVVMTGEVKYSYRVSEHSIVIGQRPIGPVKSAANRPRRRIK